jgi:hypothetical protein
MLLGCGEDETPRQESDPCGGLCFPFELCNPSTGQCEPLSGDGGASDFDDADAVDIVPQADDTSDARIDHDREPVEETPLEDGPTDSEATEDDVGDLTEGDGADDAEEPDGLPIAPPSVTQLVLTLDLPDAVWVDWAYPDDVEVDGFVITRGEERAVLPIAEVRVYRLVDGIPGQEQRISVSAFLERPGGRLESPPSAASITLPAPTAMSVSPPLEIVLAGPNGSGTPGQREPLAISLWYDESDPARADLFRGGSALTGADITLEVEDPGLALISPEAVITALAPGQTRLTARYRWGEELGQSVHAELTIRVVEPEPNGRLRLRLIHDTLDSAISFADVTLTGPQDWYANLSTNSVIEISLEPGRYRLEVTGEGLVAVPKIINVFPGADTFATHTLMRRGPCERIGREGGVVVARDGARLVILENAILEDDLDPEGAAEVCVTALPGAAGPWWGPGRSYPLFFPTAYAIETSVGELAVAAELRAPLPTDLANAILADLGTAEARLLVVDGVEIGPGPLATLGPDDADGFEVISSIRDLDGMRVFHACSAFGEGRPGSCRIRSRSCLANRTMTLDRVTGSCQSAVELSDDYTLEISSEGVIPLAARALGLQAGVDPSTSCEADPCSEGDCPLCTASLTTAACGRTHFGTIERYDAVEGWQVVSDWQVFVPERVACEGRYEPCPPDGGDVTCPEATGLCVAECPR